MEDHFGSLIHPETKTSTKGSSGRETSPTLPIGVSKEALRVRSYEKVMDSYPRDTTRKPAAWQRQAEAEARIEQDIEDTNDIMVNNLKVNLHNGLPASNAAKMILHHHRAEESMENVTVLKIKEEARRAKREGLKAQALELELAVERAKHQSTQLRLSKTEKKLVQPTEAMSSYIRVQDSTDDYRRSVASLKSKWRKRSPEDTFFGSPERGRKTTTRFALETNQKVKMAKMYRIAEEVLDRLGLLEQWSENNIAQKMELEATIEKMRQRASQLQAQHEDQSTLIQALEAGKESLSSKTEALEPTIQAALSKEELSKRLHMKVGKVHSLMVASQNEVLELQQELDSLFSIAEYTKGPRPLRLVARFIFLVVAIPFHWT